MERSKDKSTSLVLRAIGDEHIDYLKEYIKEILGQQFVSFQNEKELADFFDIGHLYDGFTADDFDTIRYYTGIDFKRVNNILRGFWDYESNGKLTPEDERYYRGYANKLSGVIEKGAKGTDNIISYRGVSIESFKKYGINELKDLVSLKDQFIFESGFMSTALVRQRSFFDRPLEWVNYCNIEIKYLIPGDNGDAIPLITNDASYSVVQTEYLINSGSLSNVVDVVVDEEKNVAYLTMVYIPKKVWDKNYAQYKNNSSTRS